MLLEHTTNNRAFAVEQQSMSRQTCTVCVSRYSALVCNLLDMLCVLCWRVVSMLSPLSQKSYAGSHFMLKIFSDSVFKKCMWLYPRAIPFLLCCQVLSTKPNCPCGRHHQVNKLHLNQTLACELSRSVEVIVISPLLLLHDSSSKLATRCY